MLRQDGAKLTVIPVCITIYIYIYIRVKVGIHIQVIMNNMVSTLQVIIYILYIYIWKSPGDGVRNQTDYITVNGRFRTSILQ